MFKKSILVFLLSWACGIVFAGNTASTALTAVSRDVSKLFADKSSAKKGKTLYGYFNLEGYQTIAKDVQNEIIAKFVVGRGGWWYKKATVQHKCYVRSVAFNPQGTALATASNDKAVHVIDAQGKRLHTLHHDARVWNARFNQQNTLLATASDDRTVCLWNERGQKIRTLKHTMPVCQVAFNDQGTLLATITNSGLLALWNIEDGQNIFYYGCGSYGQPDLMRFQKVVFHPNSTYVLIAGHACNNACVRSIFFNRYDQLGNLDQDHLLFHDDFVNDAVFNPQGTLIGTASDDNTACLWDMQGNKLHTLAHDHGVRSVRFNPQGTLLATAANNNACVWDLQGNKVLTLPASGGHLYEAEFNPQGTWLVTAEDSSSVINIWDMHGDKLKSFKQWKGAGSLTFSKVEVAFAAKNNQCAHIWQQVQKPTLPQLLLRLALREYALVKCFNREPIAASMAEDRIIEDAESTLEMQEGALQEVWKTLPETLQASIIRMILATSDIKSKLR